MAMICHPLQQVPAKQGHPHGKLGLLPVPVLYGDRVGVRAVQLPAEKVPVDFLLFTGSPVSRSHKLYSRISAGQTQRVPFWPNEPERARCWYSGQTKAAEQEGVTGARLSPQ